MGVYDDGPYEVGDEHLLNPELVPVPANSYLGEYLTTKLRYYRYFFCATCILASFFFFFFEYVFCCFDTFIMFALRVLFIIVLLVYMTFNLKFFPFLNFAPFCASFQLNQYIILVQRVADCVFQ